MKKRFLAFAIVALAAFALVFTGCDSSSGGGGVTGGILTVNNLPAGSNSAIIFDRPTPTTITEFDNMLSGDFIAWTPDLNQSFNLITVAGGFTGSGNFLVVVIHNARARFVRANFSHGSATINWASLIERESLPLGF